MIDKDTIKIDGKILKNIKHLSFNENITPSYIGIDRHNKRKLFEGVYSLFLVLSVKSKSSDEEILFPSNSICQKRDARIAFQYEGKSSYWIRAITITKKKTHILL